jgi:hypothetical protein
MREVKVGKDGVVPILDTKKLYILEVHFRDIYNRNFMSEPHYYVCITNKDGVTSFVENSIMNEDSGFVSDSIQKCVKRVLVESNLRYSSKVYEFNDVQEFEKEKNVKLCIDIKK